MNSYLFAVISLLLVFVILDMILHTQLLRNRKFWIMQLFVVLMIIAFDAYAHDAIWYFNDVATVGLYIFNTPIENVLFGFSLIGFNIIFFERELQNKNHQKYKIN